MRQFAWVRADFPYQHAGVDLHNARGNTMRRYLPVLFILLSSAATIRAQGLLIPEAKHRTPPLAMVSHEAAIAIQDQAAETTVEQTFRNHTTQPLEANYVFPIPRGASVRAFKMMVNGVKAEGKLVAGTEARRLCADCARLSQDPGVLDYLGNSLLTMTIQAIQPGKDVKVTIVYSALASQDNGLVEYVYPLKTDGKATRTLEKFSLKANIRSQHAIQNVYSPTHAITLKRVNDREVNIGFEREQALLDRDFQLFYTLTDKDVGLTAMIHRPSATEDGHFLFLISPRLEAPEQIIPRDIMLVLDTSGSMKGVKMEQARKALHFFLDNLKKHDRFALMNFATNINKYQNELLDATPEEIGKARKWVDALETTGGTAIDRALSTALDMRTRDEGRTFTVVFFTDGLPTVGETNPEVIIKNVERRNSASTRIFTFGVGYDVNATMLDRLAENTRALSTYVREEEDIKVRASAMWGKITNPVLTNLRLTAGKDIILSDTYPPDLPDLFQGGQLVVMGRYRGKGKTTLTLSGLVGKEKKDFTYDVNFQEKTGNDYAFVEHLWARRKVGYLLDQIRANGERKELVDETKLLARKYSIATPYTSYLIMSEGVVPVLNAKPAKLQVLGERPPILDRPGKAPLGLQQFLAEVNATPENVEKFRGAVAATVLKDDADGKCCCSPDPEKRARGECDCCRHVKGKCPCKVSRARTALDKQKAYEDCCNLLKKGDRAGVQAGRLGVDLSIQCCNLRNQCRVEQTCQRELLGRECIEVGGIWIDTGYDAKKTKTVAVKALSDGYFKLLEKHPELKEVFRMGTHLVWVTPSGTALLLDSIAGKETLTDEEIASLFAMKK
jgi:Ca-activated chloride channel family protein